MIEEIVLLCLTYGVDLLDIKTIQTIALKEKRYELLVFLNKNSTEYLSFVKKHLGPN